MVCDICGKEDSRIRHVARSYDKGENLLIIENIPLVSCPNCGDSYFTAETLHEIERIKLHRQSFATKRQVAIASFRNFKTGGCLANTGCNRRGFDLRVRGGFRSSYTFVYRITQHKFIVKRKIRRQQHHLPH